MVVAGLDVALRPLRWITKLKVDPLCRFTCNERDMTDIHDGALTIEYRGQLIFSQPSRLDAWA